MKNQMNTAMDVSAQNMDKDQVSPDQQVPPMPNKDSMLKAKPAMKLGKKKKPISSLAELKAVAAKMKNKPMGGM